MLKLYRYELKKNIFRLSLIFLAAAALLINFYKQFETVRYYGENGYQLTMVGENPSDIYAIYDEFKGEINESSIEKLSLYNDKMKKIIDSGNYSKTEASDEYYTGYVWGDYFQTTMMIEDVRYAYLYPNRMADINQKADEAIDFYKNLSTYEVRKNQLIKQLYAEREITVYGKYNSFELYFDYEFSSFLILILMIFVFSSTFSVESSTGTKNIMKASGGLKSVFISKQLALLTFAAAAVILFTFADLIGFGRFYGLEFSRQPLYAIEAYSNTPLNISIFTGIIIFSVLKVVVLFFLGEVIFVISALTKNTGVSLCLSFFALGALIFACGLIPTEYSVFSLFSFKTMFEKLTVVNILGFPVPSFVIALVLCIFLTSVAAVLCGYIFVYRKHKAVSKKTVLISGGAVLAALAAVTAVTLMKEYYAVSVTVNITSDSPTGGISEYEFSVQDTLEEIDDNSAKITEQRIKLTDNISGDSIIVPFGAFDSEQSISAMFATDEYLYFSCSDMSGSEPRIMRLDPDDMSMTEIYAVKSTPDKVVFGLTFSFDNSSGAVTINDIFADGGMIYFIDSGKGLFKLGGFKKAECLFEDKGIATWVYDGKYLFYIDQNHRLKRYEFQSGENIVVCDEVSGYELSADNEFIYFETIKGKEKADKDDMEISAA